jgi:hypothetical protein
MEYKMSVSQVKIEQINVIRIALGSFSDPEDNYILRLALGSTFDIGIGNKVYTLVAVKGDGWNIMGADGKHKLAQQFYPNDGSVSIRFLIESINRSLFDDFSI